MSDDIRLKTSWRTHPKRVKLQRRLGADGVLALNDLWLWCRDNKTDGDLAGMSSEDIAIAAQWHGDAEQFVDVLTEIGLMDGEPGSHRVHDWCEINPHSAGQDARIRAARMNAHTRWVKAGRCHGGTEFCGDRCTPMQTAMPFDASRNAVGIQSDANGNAVGNENMPTAMLPRTPRTPLPAPPHTLASPQTLADLEQALADAGLSFQISASERETFAKLRPEAHEISSAIAIARAREPRCRPRYVLGIIAKDRERAAGIREGPAPPPAKKRRESVDVTNVDLSHEYQTVPKETT